MTDEQALLMAVPLRHLESATLAPHASVVLPAGGVGDLASASQGLAVVLMATDAGSVEVPAATWRATFVRRVAHEPGTPWPLGVPPSWAAEHEVQQPPPDGSVDDEDDFDDDDDDEEDLVQAFLEVTGLEALPRDEWLFANELVGKQARRGRSYRPRVPTIVTLPA